MEVTGSLSHSLGAELETTVVMEEVEEVKNGQTK